jgi:hypothetical protein
VCLPLRSGCLYCFETRLRYVLNGNVAFRITVKRIEVVI